MKKKCVCVLLSAAMAMTMFAGCGNKDQASAGEKILPLQQSLS